MEMQRLNRRRCRNLPAELKVEIVDCLPLENAVHFLANVPNRLIIHHCAPRVRRMIKIIPQIAADYARTLPAPYRGIIHLGNEHKYTPELDIFLHSGAAHCNLLTMRRAIIGGFVGYPANFFDDLIKHYYQTKAPAKVILRVEIYLPLTNPAPWPAALVQPRAGEMNVEESKVGNTWKCLAYYILRNKHNPGIAFSICLSFHGIGKCYQQMTGFGMWRIENFQ